MIDVQTEYIAIGGNRSPAASDWHLTSGLFAFGADNNVALWKPLSHDHKGISTLLAGHTDKVNAVKFLPVLSAKDRIIIISGSVDRTLRIWLSDSCSSAGFSSVARLIDHTSSINVIGVNGGSSLFASGSADATIKLWKLQISLTGEIDIALLQSITTTPRFIPLALAIGRLGTSDSLILAVGGTKKFVHIHVADSIENDSTFRLVATLTGHEDWIRSLAFTRERATGDGDILLASASQDKYIRLWRIHQGEAIPAANASSKDSQLGNSRKSLSNKAHRFAVVGVPYSVTFEALLLGHEDWVYSATWRSGEPHPQLLSASADNSLAVWEQELHSGLWVCVARLGELSGQKGATTATGSTGGFWTGLWSPDGTAVLCLGRTGSWRLWSHDVSRDRWIQGIAVGGHTKVVTAVTWAEDGSYLLSSSADQTTRLHAKWMRGSTSSWHEFARPQVHGYDLNCIASLSTSQFVSGADEKLLRVFDEPRAIARMLEKHCGISQPKTGHMPVAANVPVLGLSNKAIEFSIEKSASDLHEEAGAIVDAAADIGTPVPEVDHPPPEDHLSRQTLWPESEKLYGHGYEISALACSHDHSLVATACRASTSDHAVLRLYETREWREIKPVLTAHSLTVTRLTFSRSDRYLLSVGRDRQWAIFERDESSKHTYKIWRSNSKGHSRMILDASWAPMEPRSIAFATAGRDKAVKVWFDIGQDIVCKSTIRTSQAATAVDFLSQLIEQVLYLAIGTENGLVSIYGLATNDFGIVSSYTLNSNLVPLKSITQLAWRPSDPEPITTQDDDNPDGQEDLMGHLAVASEDSSLRLYKISNQSL